MEAVHDQYYTYSSSGVQVGGLRKTARGASSPAKPALHIPELETCQYGDSKKISPTVRI